MTWKKLLVLVLGLVLFLGTLPTCKAAATEKVTPIKIGYITPLTGASALVGISELEGFKLAVKEINQAGGLLGHPIDYVVRDDKMVAATGTREAQDLVYNEKVDWLMGTCASGVALAISQIAKESKVPFLVVGSASGSITGEKGHRYVIRPMTNTYGQAGALAYVLSKKPYKKYAVMSSDYAWGRDSVKDFKRILSKERPDVNILSEEFMPMNLPDYSPYITKLAGIMPEVAAVILPSGEAATFLKQVGPTGLHKKCLIAGFYLDQRMIETLGKDIPEGVMVFSGFNFSYPGKAADEFRAKVKKELGVNAGGDEFLGYYCMQFLKAAVEKAGKIDKEAVIDAFGTISVELPQGKVTMRSCDNQGDFSNMIGVTKFVSEYEFAITVDNEYCPGGMFLPICDDIMKARAATK